MTIPAPITPSTENPIDVLLVGLGSIGSIYAYLLERLKQQTGKARVTAVARSNYKLYTDSGVTLNTTQFGPIKGWKPYRVVSSQQEALADGTRYAYGLITTKCLPDVLPTTELVKDALASGQVDAWALIQNGLGVEEDFYKALEKQDVPLISSLAWVGIMTNDDGSVVDWHGADTVVAGLYPPTNVKQPSSHAQAALGTWVALYQEGGSNTKSTDNVVAVRFSKNIWNCCWSSIQGLARTRPASFGILPAEVVAPIKTFIREVVDVGFAAGYLKEGLIQHPTGEPMGNADAVAKHCWDRIVEASLERKGKGGGHRMSLWIDVEKGRPMEVEVITGAVSRLAKQIGVSTPLLDYTYALMRGLQVELLEQIEAKKAKI